MCHCEEATTKQSRPAAAPKLDCFTAFAMTPQGPRHRPRTVSLRGGNDEAISASGGTNPRLLHSVHNDTQKTKPDCFTNVRNNTPRATPPPSNRVIVRRQRRSNLKPAAAPNQIASLAFAKTPKSHPRLLTLFAMTPQGQRHRTRSVSLRGGNDEAISASNATKIRLLRCAHNNTQRAIAPHLLTLPEVISNNCRLLKLGNAC